MESIRLTNQSGMEVTLSNIGARIVSIKIPRQDKLLEMTVVPTPQALASREPFYLGATCGPVCNRISNASFKLNGVNYRLSKNDGENCLHGGVDNLSMEGWQVTKQNDSQVVFEIDIGHLADGFPGNRKLRIGYQLTDDNSVHINLSANSDMTTPINLTNHTYFNLADDNIRNLLFKLDSDTLLERDSAGIPTGHLISSKETGFDIANWLSLGEFMCKNQYHQIIEENGVDHCFLVAKGDKAKAQLWSIKSGICLSVYSDQPAIQFYTGKFLAEPYQPYQGLCFEAQGLTDAVNQQNFEADIVTPDQEYRRNICYQFTVLD